MWVIGVEVEQETSAPPPKKNPDPPLFLKLVFSYLTPYVRIIFVDKANLKVSYSKM